MSNLYSLIQVGNLQLKSRLVMPPMATSKAENGAVTPALIDYYRDKIKSGRLGLIITEHSYVSLEGKASLHQMSLSDDCDLVGLTRLTDTIHAVGGVAFAQINHAGAAAKKEITGSQPLSCSAGTLPNGKGDPAAAMSLADIDRVVSDFALAAQRAIQAGFDGVEIHSAHGYLLNQFYSPITNRRNDEFGGDFNGRIRLHLRIIEAIRKTIGETIPLALRLGVVDGIEGGSSLADAVAAAEAFAKAGVDLLDVSGGLNGYIWPGHNEQGYFQQFSEEIKRKVAIPVLLTGGITEPSAAERLLAEQKADLIGVGRALLRDSDWPEYAAKQLQSGDYEAERAAGSTL